MSRLAAIDSKATIILGSTSPAQYSNMPTIFWINVYYFGGRGDFSSSCAIFLTRIWVAPIYVVTVFATVLFWVHTYVVLMPHILAWSYQMLIFGNTNLL